MLKILEALTEIKDGKMTAIASTDAIDRVGDSLSVDSWDFKNFKKNPVLLGGHNYQPEYVIGVAKDIRIEGNKVLFEPAFHDITEYARQIKKMFEEKILKTWSVGYLPKGSEKSQTYELLEVSAVAVPANPEALTLYTKSLKKEDGEVIENWVKTAVEEKKVEPKEGDKCEMEDGTMGTMRMDDTGVMVCMKKKKEFTDEDVKKLEEELVQLKEGRVLSGKTRGLINKTVEALKGVIDIMEKLLEETTQPAEAGVDKVQTEKSATPAKELSDADRQKIMVGILKKFNQITAEGLNKLKK
jgi:hypothetical protein